MFSIPLLTFFLSCNNEPEIIAVPPVQLRLLNRREYTQTVFALLATSSSPTTCSTNSECNLSSESCWYEQCIPDTCSIQTFIWEGDASSEVILSGDFNGWATTENDGGWKLEPLSNQGIQYIKADIASDTYEYAFIVNGTQEATQSHTVACSLNGRYEADPAQSFPSESQPKGFFFDNSADKGLVSTTHIDKYIEAAHQLSQQTNLSTLVSCDIENSACISSWIEEFGLKAFRRPMTADEEDRYQQLYNESSSASEGVQNLVLAFLTSPHFLYRKEIGTEGEDGKHILSSYEIASAMSYFLWGSLPDAALFSAAKEGTLLTVEGRRTQAQRMLKSYQAKQHFADIIAQWIGTTDLRSIDKNAFAYYNFDPQTAVAMDREQMLFFAHVAFESSGSYNELFRSSKGFINTQNAQIYEIPNISGPQFQAIELPALRSAGIISLGAFLSAHAHSDQSSPIKRGVAIRERLLCQELGEPPPNAGMAPEVDFNSSTQERFAQHTADAACSSCHQYIDPIGLAMERFDGIGQYRETENNISINPSGDLADVEGIGSGTSNTFVTLPQLSDIIVDSDRGAHCFVEQMYRFAFGRKESSDEHSNIIQLTEQFESSERNIQDLMIDIVAHEAFITREMP